ncbi:PilZ domain-containing protein [Sphingomonas astaxanthinifaciens]|uniref:PilZ domain-containing protein n=1 Tax=Sphingomonas astaxanthinifaciens DSM 22298 TaxID=1123267 RepID=A0ABQ5Z9J3_9SPHN|nr:PilZ domain-containing protein [Sphingomonas astaxanthinifaciens]GLR48136.1 hypothetical protein GCM10007925_18490 [Sphingomonas astaxanthinifaciens DSM 22298]
MGIDEVPRSEERRKGELRGYVRRSGDAIQPAEFEDVSEGGCCIRGDFRIGEMLVATIPTLGTVEAQVRWSIGGRSGLKILAVHQAEGK